jgi:hypothetical protein
VGVGRTSGKPENRAQETETYFSHKHFRMSCIHRDGTVHILNNIPSIHIIISIIHSSFHPTKHPIPPHSTSKPCLNNHLHLSLLLNLLILHHITQRALLNHQTHNLIQRIRSRHSSMLSISIVRRRNLDDVSCDQVDAFQAAENGAQFAGGPAASFRGTGGGGD